MQARILRVGGSEADYRTLEALLRGAGQGDLRSASAEEAVEIIASRGVDLLLLDLVQNSTDVFNVLRAAQPANGKTSRVPVIVTAPAGANDRIQACLQRGAEDYIHTPLDPANALVLTRRVELCLYRKELRDATVRLRAARADETATIELHSNASNRFVPREFLQHLKRSSLAEVRLGDHVQAKMAIFFSDIRDFTALSETMTPQQNFDFLNSYLKRATPIVRTNHGFIDKYIGDAIMALFAREPGDALSAGVELQRALVTYNEGRKKAGYVPVRIGIGLHYGDLIMGTIGEEERMQTTVIADAVNVASRIEGLTKTFGVSLLVSKPLVDNLRPGHEFQLRHLGAVKAKGKSRNVDIYECFNNDPRDLAEHKLNSMDLFAQGISDFRKGLFLSAGKAFARVAQLNPQDSVASYYRDSCSLSVLRDRGPSAFDGVEAIEIK